MRRAQHGPTPIPLPDPNPSIGGLARFAMQVRRSIAALRDRQVYVPNTPAPSLPGRPFSLSVAGATGAYTWSVSATYSSVTDGTNGSRIDLSDGGSDWAAGAIEFGDNTAISATAYIVLEADVDSSLDVTNWTLAAVTDPSEVSTDSGPPVTQDKVRLLIGRVIFTDGVPAASQAVFAPQMLDFGFYNGLLVKLFTAAPVNKDDL